MAYTPIPTLKDVPRYPTRSDAERLDELMQAALNGGSDMVKNLNKDFIPGLNAVIPALNSAMPNLDAIIAAPGMANQAAASATAANTAKTAAEAAKTAAATSASAAAGSATTANTAKTAAEAAKAAAATSETNAAKSATAAAGSATTATNAKTAAESARDIANTAKTSAEASKNAAAGSATSASNSATAAAGSAATATNAKTAAEAARDVATTAKAAAESAKNAAKTSETNAANSATAAAGSATTATSAKTAAESARDVANAAKTAAESAKNAAKTSETNAAASATAADTSVTHAASSATNAAQSASEAKEYRDQTVDIAHVGPASSTKLGLVKIGAGLQADAAGVARVVPASTTVAGAVKLDTYFAAATSSVGTGWIKLASASMNQPNRTLSCTCLVSGAAVESTYYGTVFVSSYVRNGGEGFVPPYEFEAFCCDSRFSPNDFKMYVWSEGLNTKVEIWAKIVKPYRGYAVRPIITEYEGRSGAGAWTFHEFNGIPTDPLPTDATYEYPLTVGHLTDALNVDSSTIGASAAAVQKVADLATSARVSSESWTLTAAVSAGGQITLPRGYIVGNHEMMLFKGGLLVNYVDVGTPGKWSTVCKLVGAASVGDVLTMVGPLGDAPSVVLDFEGGAWPKELVCSRATVDYVFDDAGKVQEVAANTPAITKDPVTGRKGLQLYGQRTRLNKYYKSVTNWYVETDASHAYSLSTFEDVNSPTGTCVRCTYAKETDATAPIFRHFGYRIQNDMSATVSSPKKYTVSVCMRANKPIKSTINVYCKRSDGTYAPTISVLENFELDTEYRLYVGTFTTPENTYLSICPRIYYQVDIPVSDITDGYIDVAYFQIEESAIPTPLIAGAEGVQMTVGAAAPYIEDNTELTDMTIVAEKDDPLYRPDGSKALYFGRLYLRNNTEGFMFATGAHGEPGEMNVGFYTKEKTSTWRGYHIVWGLKNGRTIKGAYAIKNTTVLQGAVNGTVGSYTTTLPNGFTSNMTWKHEMPPTSGLLYRYSIYRRTMSDIELASITA